MPIGIEYEQLSDLRYGEHAIAQPALCRLQILTRVAARCRIADDDVDGLQRARRLFAHCANQAREQVLGIFDDQRVAPHDVVHLKHCHCDHEQSGGGADPQRKTESARPWRGSAGLPSRGAAGVGLVHGRIAAHIVVLQPAIFHRDRRAILVSMRLSSPNISPTSTMSISPHILIVDDDADVRQLVTDYLGDFDLRVTGAPDGAAMRSTLAHNVVDLILLDIKLPSEDGMTIARELRVKSSIPIIMLTSRKDDVDRIMGLEVGADDYLTKPFNPRELVARIRTVLRRAQSQPAQTSPGSVRAYRFADWELNLRTRRLTSQTGEPVELTHTEFALLVAFLNAPQRILSREQLLELIRGDDGEVFDRSIDVQILRLRRKVESNSSRPELIKTERGLGYLFSAKVDPVA